MDHNHAMIWHKRVLVEKRLEIINSTVFAILFAIVILIWHFFQGKGFEWKTISPIEEPGLFPRIFYSALVFITFGAFLYWIKFYKLLHTLTVGLLGDWYLYRALKGLIWISLIAVMFFYVVPIVVTILNLIISFFYNLLGILLYVAPSLCVSLVIYGTGFYIFKKYR